MLFVDWKYHGKGYGKKLMEHWENDMKSQGYGMLLTSAQADENAQLFSAKLDIYADIIRKAYHICGRLFWYQIISIINM